MNENPRAYGFMSTTSQIAFVRLIAVTATVILSALLGGGGCSHKKADKPVVAGATPKRMTALATCYSLYVNRHQGKGPPDEATFKKFVRAEGKNVLTKNGLADVDTVFTSDRDNAALIVNYPKPGSNQEFTPEMIVAREQTGQDGKRLVVFATGIVREFDKAALDSIGHASAK